METPKPQENAHESEMIPAVDVEKLTNEEPQPRQADFKNDSDYQVALKNWYEKIAGSRPEFPADPNDIEALETFKIQSREWQLRLHRGRPMSSTEVVVGRKQPHKYEYDSREEYIRASDEFSYDWQKMRPLSEKEKNIRAEQQKIRKELKEVFNPLSVTAAEKIKIAFDADPNRVYEALDEKPELIPYSITKAWGRDSIERPERRDPEDNVIEQFLSSRRDEDIASLIQHVEQANHDWPDKLHDKNSGQSEEFIYAPVSTEQTQMFRNRIMIPVGEYGEKFANKILYATSFMIKELENTSFDDSREVTGKHQNILKNYTARGRGGATAVTSLETVQEGILSIAQVVALLTSEKIPGYDDPTVLTEQIIRSGLIEKVTRLLPMGFIGPTTIEGRYFRNALVVKDDGTLGLEPGLEKRLIEAHVDYMKSAVSEYSKEGKVKHSAGLTCPVLGPGGGIEELSKTMSDILSNLPEQNDF